MLNVWIGNLGKYNEGELVGEWLKLPVSKKELETFLREKVKLQLTQKEVEGALTKDGFCYEEYMINDYETDLPIRISEYTNLTMLNLLAMASEKVNNMEAVEAYIESQDIDDIKEIINVMLQEENIPFYAYEEDYGNCTNEEKYGISKAEWTGLQEILDKYNVSYYFDYEKYGADDNVILYDSGYIDISDMNNIDLNYYSLEEIKKELNYNNVDINKLKQEDLKEKVFGHWGCCPGINYCYAHINRFILKTKIEPNIIIGTGYGSPALISNLYINGSLGKMYPKYKYGLEGMNNLISDFGKNMILQTEISPLLPGVILAGGELGNAISVSMGTVINNPKQTTLTIVGDGEFEAGTTLSSLLCNQLINSKNDGFLVIMINLNGYKMTSRSLISLNEDFARVLESFGYEVFITSINNYEETGRIFDEIANRQKKWYEGEKEKIPIVILKSPKGFSAPETIDGLAFVNSHLSHKVSTLKIPKDIENSVGIIQKWLMSYKPESLFVNGVPSKSVLENIPKIRKNDVEKNIRNAKRININSLPANEMKALSKYFIESTDEDFLIFSPDESISNGLNDFVNRYGIRYNAEIDSSIRVKEKGRIVEFLNEVICITMLYGYLNRGGDGVFITYEAFSPLVSSFLSQCYKFYKQQKEGNVKEIYNSLKIIITSLGWRNTYTHQNPDLLNTLLSKEAEYVKIYFPSEPKQAIFCFEEMERAENSIQVLYLTKTDVNTYRTIEQAKTDVKRGYWIKKFKNVNSSNRILLIAIGDIITNECLKASESISDRDIDVLSIIKSDCLQKLDIDIKKYHKVLVYCTGYCDIIRGKLSKMFDTTKWLFKGYNDSTYGTYKNVLESNGIDIQSIRRDIKEDYYEL